MCSALPSNGFRAFRGAAQSLVFWFCASSCHAVSFPALLVLLPQRVCEDFPIGAAGFALEEQFPEAGKRQHRDQVAGTINICVSRYAHL